MRHSIANSQGIRILEKSASVSDRRIFLGKKEHSVSASASASLIQEEDEDGDDDSDGINVIRRRSGDGD